MKVEEIKQKVDSMVNLLNIQQGLTESVKDKAEEEMQSVYIKIMDEFKSLCAKNGLSGDIRNVDGEFKAHLFITAPAELP